MAKKKEVDESAIAAENRVLRKNIEKLEKPKGIPNAQTKKKEVVVIPDKVLVEREIRKYVKRSGGFRKKLSGDDLDRAKYLLGKAGRPYKKANEGEKQEGPKWNTDIQVPGMVT